MARPDDIRRRALQISSEAIMRWFMALIGGLLVLVGLMALGGVVAGGVPVWAIPRLLLMLVFGLLMLAPATLGVLLRRRKPN
ncbi:MAG TPA: hypothetical protein VG387_00215 [Rhizomicrobium sp.]|jgi:hypothetical protein|nr:hypothetical protein [Rhizomicrobium sp.]